VAADFAPLITRIHEVAAGAGSTRVVTTSNRPRAYEADPAQEAARAVKGGPGIEVIILDDVHAARSVSEKSRVKFIDLGLVIRIEWPVPQELLDSQRSLMRAACWSFKEELRAALQWSGNLQATTAGAATYVRGGCLDRYGGTTLEREDFPKRRYSIRSRFRCFVDAPQ
jgi:hypothetical protein